MSATAMRATEDVGTYSFGDLLLLAKTMVYASRSADALMAQGSLASDHRVLLLRAAVEAVREQYGRNSTEGQRVEIARLARAWGK